MKAFTASAALTLFAWMFFATPTRIDDFLQPVFIAYPEMQGDMVLASGALIAFGLLSEVFGFFKK